MPGAWRFCALRDNLDDLMDPVVQRRRRLRDMQESAGSSPAGITLNEWSVGVSAAHLRGKQEDRVQFPDRPLNQTTRAAGPMGRHLICTQVIGVRFPGGPLSELG